MRAPAGLGSAGKAAWKRAVAAIPPAPDDRFWDAAARFAHAVDLAAAARRAWKEAGGPLLLEQGNGCVSEHPLLKAMTVAERDAARYGASCCVDPAAAAPKRAPGRPKASASAPDRSAAAPPKIRLVK